MIYLIDNSSDTKIPASHYELGTIDDVVKYCEDKKVLGVDTETEGFDFTCKKMIMFQIGDEDNQFIIDTRFVSIEPLKEILENKDIIKIFHNAKFDYKFIKKWSGISCEGIYDTFLTELVISCGKSLGYGLKDLCHRYLNVTLNKETRNLFIGLTGQPFTVDQIVYGAKDVEYLCQLKNLQQPNIDKYQLQNVVDLENSAVLALADMEFNGLELDNEQWKTLESVNTKKADALALNLDQNVIETSQLKKFVAAYVQTDMFTPVE